MRKYVFSLLLLTLPLLAVPPAGYDFTDAGTRPWRMLFFTRSAFEAGIGFALRKNDQGRLYSPPLELQAEDFGELHIIGVTTTTRAKLFFATPGQDFTEAASCRAFPLEGKLVFSLASNPRWKGTIAALRIDLTQGDDESRITALTLEKGEPPNSLRSPWKQTTALQPNQATPVIRRELPFPQGVECTAQSTTVLELRAEWRDILGNRIQESPFSLSAGNSRLLLPCVPTAAEILLSLSNPTPTEATFTLELIQPTPALPPPPSSPTCQLLNPLEQTTRETTWIPRLRLSQATGRFLLALLGNGTRTILADQELASDQPELPLLHLRFLPSGNYRLEATLDGVPCVLSPNPAIRHGNALASNLPQSRAILAGMRPAYRLGDEELGTMEYLLSDPPADDNALRYASQMADIMPVTTARLIFRYHPDGSLDFSELDNILQTILLRHPRQAISLHVSVTDPGPSWRERHPEEGIQDSEGNFRVRNYRDTPEATSSMASKRWLQDSCRMLRLLIRHLEEIPAGERILSILPCAGITWEWIHWGSARGVMVDYSSHFRAHFLDFLRRRYGDDIARLNQAWHTDYPDFQAIQLPTPEKRFACEGDLRPPARFQQEIDFAESISDLVSGCILELCHCIKEATNGRVLTGAYYGYTNYILNGSRIHDGGHQMLTRLLEAPDIDILMAPSRYATRSLGEVGGFMQPDASARLHGKLLISECDVRPFNADNALGKPATLAASRAIIQREYANQVAGEAAMRWFDFSRGWVAKDPRLFQLAAEIARQDEELHRRPALRSRDGLGSCAVITSEQTSAMLARESLLNFQLVEEGYSHLLRSGLACSFYDLHDLPAIAGRHRIILFLNTLRFTPEQQKCLDKLVSDPKNTLWFSPVTGLMQDGTPNLTWAERFLHCPFELESRKQNLSMGFTAEAERLFGIPAGTTLEMRQPCGNFAFPRQAEGLIPLAHTPDGRIALAMRENGARLVWSALPIMPESLIRAIAIQTGLPAAETIPPAPVWLGPDSLSVHTARPTEVILHNLPGLPQRWNQPPDTTTIHWIR